MKVRHWLGFTVLALGAYPASARADEKQVCIASSERGQRMRIDGKLREARREFANCSRNECPAVVRNDCANWLNEVTNAIPSVAVSARDGQGKDITDARVFIDGELLAEKLDGRALPVDVGSHVIRVEHAGDAPVEKSIVVREGEKARGVDVRFGADAPPPPAAPQVAGEGPPSDGGHTLPPWIVFGGGAAIAVTGVVLHVVGRAKVPDQCDYSTRKCDKGTPQAISDDASSATQVAQFGLATAIVGAVVAAAGLTWHFLEPTEKKTSSLWLRPDLGPARAGMSVGGAL